VIGGGWIGLEPAAAARAAGAKVTVLEAAELPLLRVLGPEVAKVFAGLHRNHEANLRCGVQISEVTGRDGQVTGVALAEGSVIGHHAQRRAGRRGGPGVGQWYSGQRGPALDRAGHLRGRRRGQHLPPDPGRHIRVKHWANALHQPQAATRAMLDQAVSYDRMPNFFTDSTPGHGVHRVRGARSQRRGRVPQRPSPAGVHRLLARVRRPGTGQDERQRVDATKDIQALVRSGAPVDRKALSDPAAPLESQA